MVVSFGLGVEDLADTRFALSPLHETVVSLRVLREPGLSALHLPWRRSVLGRLDDPGGPDTGLLLSLVSARRTLPDFLTPRPGSFAPTFEEELAVARRTAPGTVRRDLLATHAPTRSRHPCATPSPPPRGYATPSANSWRSTGSWPSGRPGPGCGSCWRPT